MNKEMLITSLINRGWYLEEEVFSSIFCNEFINEAQILNWQMAKIGKGAQQQLEQKIRNDSIYWLPDNPLSTHQKSYLEVMDELRLFLNKELYLGLKEFECHLAFYQSGGFYKKHLDQHQGSKSRAVSIITYLNSPQGGGELVIYKKENPIEEEVIIKPKAGSFVCFLSDQIYHEVLPTSGDRYSLTGWLRTTPA